MKVGPRPDSVCLKRMALSCSTSLSRNSFVKVPLRTISGNKARPNVTGGLGLEVEVMVAVAVEAELDVDGRLALTLLEKIDKLAGCMESSV